jgi:hypothetical protein
MARPKRGGRLTTSTTPPQLFSQQRKNSTETKYFGLVRDNALSDLTAADKALDEVLTDIQDPAEAATLGKFVANDLQIIDAALRFDLKKEDFEILLGASINAEEEETGRLIPFINPRQRISDRIKQFEGFAGRGTVFQGQGTTLFKYFAPEAQYNHTNPPPFYTQPLGPTSTENAPDFVPSTEQQIEASHRIGFVQNGQFVPSQDPEWWWNGEYNHEFRDRAIYGLESQTALDNPTYPIVRDGNLKFSVIFPEGINSTYNWGLRFDAWFKKDDFGNDQNFMRWVAQVNGHVRIDYFDRTGYDSNGAIEGTWKTALNTTDPSTYYTQLGKEDPVQSIIGSRLYYLQGGPTTPLGEGTGTLPTQRSAADGGALDLNATFLDREGIARSKFNNDYVPVVIRFWYGRPNPAVANPTLSAPSGVASLVLGAIDSSILEANLPLWNDYSAQIRVVYDDALNAWRAEGAEENFANFTNNFEILSHGMVGNNPAQPSSLEDYIVPDGQPIIATKTTAPNEDILVQFSIPGVTANNGQKVWIVAKNRPWETLPSGNRIRTSLWQRYLFHPNPLGTYRTSEDLLDGRGENYVEPEPLYSLFEDNPSYYKAKYGQLPSLSTYGPDRYDGMLPNTLRSSASSRDYDYSHENLLLVGRQKKAEGIKPLAPQEVRKNAENYTFIEVTRNAAGRGGSVTINAYPTNNLSVQSTSVNNAQVGKFLHMGDNKKTFTDPSRQNISSLGTEVLPSGANFPAAARIKYEEIGGSGRLVYGAWDGTSFTPNTTGIIAQLSMGTGAGRSHGTKSAFLTDFTTVAGVKHSFYGMIGIVRDSAEGQTLTVESNGTSIISPELFSNSGETSNNSQYLGTEIIFGGSATVHRVTSYAASTSTITITPSKTAGTYANSEVWYNHFSLGGLLPDRVVNSSTNANVTRGSVLAPGGFAQISFVFNQAYQFTRADNGAGLSFGEVLYAKEAASGVPANPFVSDSELPAPPADIVLPFGYDNTPSASDPGLGGLCYPPYSVQNIALQPLAVDDATLYGSAIGNYDLWWGARQAPLNLGGRSLTITSKLLFDINPSDRSSLLLPLTLEADKRAFNGTEYSHKLELELEVELPTPPSSNVYIFNDVKLHSNNKPVKDKYYLFINNNSGNLEVLSPTNPSWQ